MFMIFGAIFGAKSGFAVKDRQLYYINVMTYIMWKLLQKSKEIQMVRFRYLKVSKFGNYTLNWRIVRVTDVTDRCMKIFSFKIYESHFKLAHSFCIPYTVPAGFCDHPPSEGLRSLNPEWSLKQESGYSDQVVAKYNVCFVLYYIYQKIKSSCLQA